MWLLHQMAVVVLLIAASSSAARADAELGAKTSTAFLSACRTRPDDRMFDKGTVLALIYETGQTSSVLYEVGKDGPQSIAWLHFATAKNEEFLEAEGGVRSTALASDVIKYLRAMPFSLRSDWRSALSTRQAAA